MAQKFYKALVVVFPNLEHLISSPGHIQKPDS